MIIGLNGYARSGKNAAAEVLVEQFGFTQMAFADKLRDVLYVTDPVVVANWEHHNMVPAEGYDGPVYTSLKSVIDKYGWERYKNSPFSDDIRRLLQRLGTEAGRGLLGENIWVDSTLNHLPSGHVVITDVRFKNEAEAIRERGGYVWRINREGIGPANDHHSEVALDNWSGFTTTLYNTGDLENYRNYVRNTFIAQFPGL